MKRANAFRLTSLLCLWICIGFLFFILYAMWWGDKVSGLDIFVLIMTMISWRVFGYWASEEEDQI